jgi:hypothetical protein
MDTELDQVLLGFDDEARWGRRRVATPWGLWPLWRSRRMVEGY